MPGSWSVSVGPSYDLVVTQIAVGDSLGEVLAAPSEDLRAGEGREFIAALVVAEPASPAPGPPGMLPDLVIAYAPAPANP